MAEHQPLKGRSRNLERRSATVEGTGPAPFSGQSRLGRREFCLSSAAALVGLSIKGDRAVAGSFVNDEASLGHLLRARRTLAPTRATMSVPVVIVGGGIAGLSAAWRLQKKHFDRFVLLEMSGQAGGNSRWGQNETSAYPWGAHYVPVPGPRAVYVRELFSELGLLRADGSWDERHLCHAQQERLFVYGRWQDGIEPAIGLTASDRDEFRRFADLTNGLHASGRFTVPLDAGLSRRDEPLDRMSFAAWLAENRFSSRPLLWYANYACRDDYGALASDVSAWAGLHYFSSREREETGPLTWPEGNGWIVRQLLARVERFVRPSQMVRAIERDRSGFRVRTDDTEYRCRAVIFAAPTFLAPYVVDGMSAPRTFEYSPWITANLTLEQVPDLDRGAPAWDNVVMNSPALGYVDAMHQSLRSFVGKSVWTFYWALADGSPSANRESLLARDWAYWKEAILTDLERVHPRIRSCVSRVDVMRMGHAMVRPTVGAVFSPERASLKRPQGGLIFAHSDVSGLSLFEEAQDRGVTAAERVLAMRL
jgi:glycine/D-amino acid oxidase-like deaminating enzyme